MGFLHMTSRKKFGMMGSLVIWTRPNRRSSLRAKHFLALKASQPARHRRKTLLAAFDYRSLLTDSLRASDNQKQKMEAPKTIQHEIGGIQNDAFRFGLHGVKSNILESHPLESAYKSAKDVQEDMKRKVLANTYGSAFPLKLDLDRQILSRFQRPPGPVPSSMLGLEAVTGSLDDIGFEDYLNDPRDSETLRVPDMHHGMEVRLGLSKGPVCPSFI